MNKYLKLTFCLIIFTIKSSAQTSLSEESINSIVKDSTTKQDIINLLGSPASKHIETKQEIWNYKNSEQTLRVYFKNNKVASYSYSSGTYIVKKNIEEDYNSFIELVGKVQEDKSLKGDFMYKGTKATIEDDKKIITTIGKFINIRWGNFSAYYHNTLGYMTKGMFNPYGKMKAYKINDTKYCKENNCTELRTDKKHCYIMSYRDDNLTLKEIK